MELLGNLTIRQVLSDNLVRLRKLKRWTQHDLSAVSGTPAGTIQHYEQQRRFPRVEEMEVLAQALGVNAWDLVMPPGAGGPSLPPDIADALNRCGPGDWDIIRAVLRGTGKLTTPTGSTRKSDVKEGA